VLYCWPRVITPTIEIQGSTDGIIPIIGDGVAGQG